MNTKNRQLREEERKNNCIALIKRRLGGLIMFIDRESLSKDLSELTLKDLSRLFSLLSPTGILWTYQQDIKTTTFLLSVYDIYLLKIFGTLLYRNFRKEAVSTSTDLFGDYRKARTKMNVKQEKLPLFGDTDS